MQRRRDADQRRETDGEQLAEEVRSAASDAEADPHERPEAQHHAEDAEEAELLADRGENEVGVSIGEVAELLLALSEAHAEHLSRAEPDERLLDLPARFLGSGPRVQECQHARHAVLRRGHGTEEQGQRHDADEQEVADAGAGGEHDDPRQHHDQHGHREVGLEEDEPRERGDDHEERQHAQLEGADLLALLGGERRGPYDDRELGKLGGLQGHDAEVYPAPGAVEGRGDGVGERQQGDQQEKGDGREQPPRPALPHMIIEAGHDRREDARHEGGSRLAHGDPCPHSAAAGGHEARGAVHFGESQDDEHGRDDREQAGLPAAVGHIASTSLRKVAPRSS